MEPYQLLALTLSSALSSVAITFSLFSFFKTRKITLYQDLDRLYFEVLKLGMANPQFIDSKLTRDYKNSFEGNDLLSYNAYAFIVWNVCETIADRQKHKALFKTW